MTASTSAHHSTILIQPNSSIQSQIRVALWLHIILMITGSLILFPTIIILKQRSHSWSIPSEVVTFITIMLGTITTYFQQTRYQSSSHSTLGYFIVLLLAASLSINIWRSKFYLTTKIPNKIFIISQHIIFIALPLLLYIEILLGVIALLAFCSSPYTQQCFGHLGIGSLYLLYFSFWAFLIHDNRTSGLRSEVLDAMLLVPCGLGLSLFGHAWGYPWDDESLQHVALGIFTLISVILSTLVIPTHNIFPGLVSMAAGYTFLSHPSKLNHILSSFHQAIGILNAGIGICRILDVVFVMYQHKKIGIKGPWNVLASFLGIMAGIITMVANEEQAGVLKEWGVRSSSLFMGAAAAGMGVLGYVVGVTILVSGGGKGEKNGRYKRVEMEGYGSREVIV